MVTIPVNASPADAPSRRLARNWWAVLLRGILAVLFGALALALPLAALGSLALIFAAYMLADGILAIIAAIRAAQAHERWGWLVLEGSLGIAAGLAAALLPGIAVLTLVMLSSAWAIVSGVILLTAAFRLHPSHGRWWMALAGLVSILWGGLLYLAPIAGALVLAMWIGAYALVFGTLLLFLALRLRRLRTAVASGGPTATASA